MLKFIQKWLHNNLKKKEKYGFGWLYWDFFTFPNTFDRWLYMYNYRVSRFTRADRWPIATCSNQTRRSQFIKDEVLLTVSCPIFPSILIAKNLLTGSLKNRSIDNLETQKKSISMKNSQFFDYLLYAKSK